LEEAGHRPREQYRGWYRWNQKGRLTPLTKSQGPLDRSEKHSHDSAEDNDDE
jgi:hypothetical protein